MCSSGERLAKAKNCRARPMCTSRPVTSCGSRPPAAADGVPRSEWSHLAQCQAKEFLSASGSPIACVAKITVDRASGNLGDERQPPLVMALLNHAANPLDKRRREPGGYR